MTSLGFKIIVLKLLTAILVTVTEVKTLPIDDIETLVIEASDCAQDMINNQ